MKVIGVVNLSDMAASFRQIGRGLIGPQQVVYDYCARELDKLAQCGIDHQPVSAAVAGVPAVVEPAALIDESHNRYWEAYHATHKRNARTFGGHAAGIAAVIAYVQSTAAPSVNASPLPQADMPRDATEGVSEAQVDAAVSAYGSAPFDPQDADPHRTAIDLAGAAAERVRAGSTAVSAGEADALVAMRAFMAYPLYVPGTAELEAMERALKAVKRACPAAPDMESKDAVAQGEAVAWRSRANSGQPWGITQDESQLSACRRMGHEIQSLYLSPPPTTGSDGRDAKDAVDEWQPIATAPDECIVANITSRLWWAAAAKRGSGALRCMWYTLSGISLCVPTHWRPTNATAMAQLTARASEG